MFPALYDLICSILGKNVYSGKKFHTFDIQFYPNLYFQILHPAQVWHGENCVWKFLKSEIAGAMQGTLNIIFKHWLKILS